MIEPNVDPFKFYPPGSDAAIEKFCRCPVLDNGHGKGAWGGTKTSDGSPMFWISGDCPLHGQKVESSRKEDEQC